MIRLPDWQHRLSAVMERWQSTEFKLGVSDCAVFAAQCIDAQCATAFETQYRNAWARESESETLQLVNDAGGVLSIMNRIIGEESVPFAQCMRGDVVAYRAMLPGWSAALAIHDGHNVLAPLRNSLVVIPPPLLLCGWRIG